MGVFPAKKPLKGLYFLKVFTPPPVLMMVFLAVSWGVRTARSQLPPIFQGPPGFHESCRSSLSPSSAFSDLFASDSDFPLEREQGEGRNPITHPAFTLLSFESLEDHAMNAAVYVHRTGLRVYSLSSPASGGEMSLSICFKTPSEEMYGTSSVLADAVFQGSVRYPVSFLISKISKKSLGSYFYIHVWPERTCFDMATTNKKDFYNLLGVHLDSVFQPLAVRDPLILAESGWRYELVPKGMEEETGEETEKETAKDCVASPHLCELRFAGNGYEKARSKLEMVEYILYRSEAQELFPDVEPYAKFTVGELKEMNNLSFSHLKRYHEAHYTPQNGWIVIHGPDDVKDRLDAIDNYLNSINAKDAMPRDAQIQAQPAFKAPRYSERLYATDSEQLEDLVVVGWVLDPGSSDEYASEENELTFKVLSYLLVDGERAPLGKALKRSGLGKEIYHRGSPFLFRHRTFSVGLRGVDQREGAAAEIESLIMKTLKELPPFTAAAIEEAIDGAELKHAAYFRTVEQPAGITLARVMNAEITHNRDPLSPLRYTEAFKALRRRIANGEKVFETIIQKYLVSNPHRVTLRLKASNTMQGDIDEAQEVFLESIKRRMTQQQLKAIVDQQESIRKRSDTPDTPEALSTLPVLKREDISQKAQEIPFTQTTISGSPLLLFPIPQPNLIYFEVSFSLSSFSLADLQLVPLMSLMLEEAGTQELLPEHFNYLVNKNTRLFTMYHFASNPAIPFTVPNPKDALGYLSIKGAALNRKLGSLLCLMHLILMSPAFGNAKTGIEIIRRLIRVRGKKFHSKAIQLAGFHSAGKFGARLLAMEGVKGISSLSFYNKLLNQAMVDWAPIACALNSLWNRLVTRSNVIFSITGEAAALSSVTTGPFSGPLKALVEALPERRSHNDIVLDKKETGVFRGTKETKGDERGPPPKAFTDVPLWAVEAEEKGLLVPLLRKAYVVPIPASHLSVSLPFVSPGSLISGAMVAAAALQRIYLEGLAKEEMGGKQVVGSFRNEGVFTFGSSKDHNVVDTIMYILGAADWLKRWARTASDQDFFDVRLYLLKGEEQPIKDEDKAQEGLLRWVAGLTEADIVKNKMGIVETTRQDVLSIAESFENKLKEESPAVTIIGNLRDVHTLQKEGIDLEVKNINL